MRRKKAHRHEEQKYNETKKRLSSEIKASVNEAPRTPLGAHLKKMCGHLACVLPVNRISLAARVMFAARPAVNAQNEMCARHAILIECAGQPKGRCVVNVMAGAKEKGEGHERECGT